MGQESKRMEIQRWRKMPVVVEATRWFKNGDHPQDYVGMEVPNSNGDGGVHERMEGLVVRFFRHPAIRGVEQCKHCNVTMHAHGWIDTLEGGHIVCPGDWIITGVKGERYPCKPDIFAATYEPESTPDHAAAMRAAQDAIAVEKRALLNANAELRKDTERMRVMREALEVARAALNNAAMSRPCPLYEDAFSRATNALASTAPMKRCGCGMGPDEICETCNGTGYANAAPVAEAGQKEGE